MIKGSISRQGLAKLYKRDLMGRIILKRKSLIILKFLKKAYNLKVSYDKKKEKKNYNFFRILNVPIPLYIRKKTKYGKYFFKTTISSILWVFKN
jgi:hypothetical protein